MSTIEIDQSAPGPNRRDLLKLGALGTLGLGASEALAGPSRSSREGAVILLTMVGGPGSIETFDPKPEAPAEFRGPFRPIATSCPGVRVVEHLPGIARRMRRLTLVRSLHHQASPIHETGLQLLGTGQLARGDSIGPHLGSIAARFLGSSGGLPPFVILPREIGPMGVNIPTGQSAGTLGPSFEPFILDQDPASTGFDPAATFDRARRFLDEAPDLTSAGTPDRSSRRAFDLSVERPSTREAYGRSTFGQSCLMARRLVEAGVRVVVVNMAETVFGRASWDAHGHGPFSSLDDYARDLLPSFDRAFSALVDDLDASGLLATTLVVASGEFGRTPKLNEWGGRDHWPRLWSALLAGGGTAEGRVIGASDPLGGEPVDRPVALPELFATMARVLGLGSPEGVEASAIVEAFA